MATLYLSRRKTLQMQRNESRAQMRPGKTPRSPSTSSSILSGSILGMAIPVMEFHVQGYKIHQLRGKSWDLVGKFLPTATSNTLVHRGTFCKFPFRWICYCHSSKSTGKENSKTHLIVVAGHARRSPIEVLTMLKVAQLQ